MCASEEAGSIGGKTAEVPLPIWTLEGFVGFLEAI